MFNSLIVHLCGISTLYILARYIVDTFEFQFLNVIIFTTEAIFFYVPNIWIIFGLVLWEGLLGGGAYVNTFYRMTEDVRKFSTTFR